MLAIAVMERILSKSDSKVSWLALANVGTPVRDPSWTWGKDKLPLFENYQAVRVCQAADETLFKLKCCIRKTTLNKPWFHIDAYRYLNAQDTEERPTFSCSSLTSTTVANLILKRCNVMTAKKWSGVKFFGFDRKDVMSILSAEYRKVISSCDSGNSTNNTDIIPENVCVDIASPDAKLIGNCAFIGVMSYGSRITGAYESLFIREHDGRRFYLPNGYSAKRAVSVQNGERVIVTCKVEIIDNVINFICETNDMLVKLPYITKAVTSILEHIKSSSKRNFSGFDFFGFHRKDVLDRLAIPNYDVSNVGILKNISDIRKRNSCVKTSELVSKPAKLSRNEKIHAVVNYASYNDLKSYLDYLLDNHTELLIEYVEGDEDLKKQFLKKLGKFSYLVKI